VKPVFAYPSTSDTETRLRAVAAKNAITTLPAGLSAVDYVKQNHRSLAAGSPVHVLDITPLEYSFNKWRHFIPRADMFYAMKCNTDPVILQALFAMGAGFDCASKHEMQLALDLGCAPARIIFANPAKLPSDIEFAANHGIGKMTFDSEDELYKIAAAFARVAAEAPAGTTVTVAQPVLRIITDDSHSVCKFSAKFGAHVEDCEHLLTVAAALGLGCVGVSFHVGSGCNSVLSYVKAVQDARRVFDMGYVLGHPMYLLDLGGGYPGHDGGLIDFPSIGRTISPVLDEIFPPALNAGRAVSPITGQAPAPLHVIAEPGRFFAHASMTFATPIIARRVNKALPSWETKRGEASKQPHALYYIGDGLYGAFNCVFYDHYTPEHPHAMFADAAKQAEHDGNVAAFRAARARRAAVTGADAEDSDSEAEAEAGDAAAAARKEAKAAAKKMPAGHFRIKVFGPTCDGLDCVYDEIALPLMDVDDWLVFPNLGAYTVAAQSSFNGIPRPVVQYVRSDKALFDFEHFGAAPAVGDLTIA
jgi:ornithine decarboxylase